MTQDEIIAQPTPSQSVDEPVAYTGTGSLEAVKANVEGFIFGYSHPSHPIPLYTKPQPTSQDWFEMIEDVQKFTDELGIVGMVGSVAWKNRIKQAIKNKLIEQPKIKSLTKLD